MKSTGRTVTNRSEGVLRRLGGQRVYPVAQSAFSLGQRRGDFFDPAF